MRAVNAHIAVKSNSQILFYIKESLCLMQRLFLIENGSIRPIRIFPADGSSYFLSRWQESLVTEVQEIIPVKSSKKLAIFIDLIYD